MRINQMQNHEVKKVQTEKANKLNLSSDGQRADRVTISSKALNVKDLKLELKKIPEIRKERINQIKNKIQQGTYQVSAQVIARKMINFKDWE